MTVLVGTWLRSTFELIGLRVGATAKFSIGRVGTHISLQAPATRLVPAAQGKPGELLRYENKIVAV